MCYFEMIGEVTTTIKIYALEKDGGIIFFMHFQGFIVWPSKSRLVHSDFYNTPSL